MNVEGLQLVYLIGAVITALGGGAGIQALLTSGRQRRQADAETDQAQASVDKIVTDTLGAVIEQIRTQADRASIDAAASRKQLTEVERSLRSAEAEMLRLRRALRLVQQQRRDEATDFATVIAVVDQLVSQLRSLGHQPVAGLPEHLRSRRSRASADQDLDFLDPDVDDPGGTT